MDDDYTKRNDSEAAADLARAKLAALYGLNNQQNTTTPEPEPTSTQPAPRPTPAAPQSYNQGIMYPDTPARPQHPTQPNSGQFHIPTPANYENRVIQPPPAQHQAPNIHELYQREQTLQGEAERLPQTPAAPDHQLPPSHPQHTIGSPKREPTFQLPGTATAPGSAPVTTTHHAAQPAPPSPQIYTHTPPTPATRREQLLQHMQNATQSSRNNTFVSKVQSLWHRFYYGDDITPGHGKSLMRALSVSLILVIFYNHQIIYGQIQYYISPGAQVVSPSIIDPNAGQDIGKEPRIIIPKINVDVPVVYDITSWSDTDVQQGLERGVVHYGTTALPGEIGNNVIVGHSSNSVWNGGKYKFAFVLLDQLDTGDTFVMDYEGERYIYEVFKKKVIEPTDVSILDQSTGEPITTLITCTPPGTSWRRLVVQARQISPNPLEATKQDREIQQDQIIPGNTSSLFDKVRNWFN